MKKKWLMYLLLFALVFIVTLCYTCFCLQVSGDEVWNYVFSLHIFDAILVRIMMIMLFKILSWKLFIVYPFIIFCGFPSYNLLSLFWFLILFLLHIGKDSDVTIGFIIGLLFLTKQNVGICMFFVYLILSKNKLKMFASFLIPVFSLIIYLIYYNALCQFIDYCFLGMLDFGKKNSNFISRDFLVMEIIILIYLAYRLIYSKFRDKEVIFIFVFQILIYPIVDIYHFLLCLFPVIYLIIKDIRSPIFVVGVFGFVIFKLFYPLTNIHTEKDFLYLRKFKYNFSIIEESYYKYRDISDYQFFCFINAYLYKLYMDIPINKYDLMANGNMVYNGGNRFVKEIDKLCANNSCVFFIEESMYDWGSNQFSKEIFDYIVTNYKRVDYLVFLQIKEVIRNDKDFKEI